MWSRRSNAMIHLCVANPYAQIAKCRATFVLNLRSFNISVGSFCLKRFSVWLSFDHYKTGLFMLKENFSGKQNASIRTGERIIFFNSFR